MPRIRIFPGIIFVLLGMNMVIVGITVYAANMNGGAAVEPDYYRKAMAYDTLRVRSAQSDALDWRYHVELVGSTAERQLRVTITEPTGQRLTGATSRAEAFPGVRANERTKVLCREIEPGVYAAPVQVRWSGLWRIELTTESRGRLGTFKTDIHVQETP